MTTINELKEEFKNKYIDEDVSVWKIYLLMHMAENDIYPNGTFSDAECSLWSKFRSLYKRGK